ncbi:hypothetical protein [Tenacibaculum sediminilitoris]|uniref:hypothetical protein n=1 Tax=Tenacibaculum sediminilitoris TaxID=1820334 RepID=UPI0038B65B1E
MFFYTNDLFLFSESWFADYENIMRITNQQWFGTEYTEMGEFALINIFGLFFKISSEMSLQMFGFLQCSILSILIFWIVKKTSVKTPYFIPFFSALLFLGGLIITPIDIPFIFKHRKIFSVFIIFFPILFSITEKQHYYKYRTHLIYFSFALLAISFLAFSSLLIIVLPSLLFLAIYDSKKSVKQKTQILFLFIVIPIITILGYYATFNYGVFNIPFFIRNSFIEISNFSKIKNLYFQHINIVTAVSLTAIAVIILNILIKRTNIESILISSLYLFLAALFQTRYYLIDENLFLLIFSVLTPIMIGISINNLIFNHVKIITVKAAQYLSSIIVISTVFILIFIQRPIISQLKNSNETNRQILATYDKIITNHLPYSFAVVNNEKTLIFSKYNHFFMNYSELNKEYLIKDSVFHTNKNKKDFLKNNPHTILPNSIFLFEILGVDKNISRVGFLTSKKQLKTNDSLLNVLRSRNREIELFTNTKRLRVYKIINKKNSCNIDKMLLYDKRL